MNRHKLPAIRLDSRPSGLKFRAPPSAVSRWDRTIKAKAADPAICAIDVMGEIGDSGWGAECTTAKMVKAQLGAAGKATPVLVTMNSPGGDAFEGIAIYNLLREHPGKVTVHVLAMAASAASVIAMAGDRIEMAVASSMMIHSAWGIVMGNRNDMREFADVLDMLDKSVAAVYAARTGLSQDEVLTMMEKETWMSADKCVVEGFADVAEEDKKKTTKAATRTPIFASVHPAVLAASGDKARPVVRLSASPPGASGTQHQSNLPKGKIMKSLAEQIVEFENKRAASAARMNEIMSSAADKGVTLDETETQEYDGLADEIKTVDAHIVRLKAHEAVMVATATPLAPAKVDDPVKASQARSGILSVKSNVEPGIKMARYVMAQIRGNGNLNDALSIVQNNKRWMDQTPEVAKVLMAAVAAGDTTTPGWASELVYADNLATDFIDVLRPQTILGKITGLRRVPFNIRVGGMASGGTGYWVGQGKPIPVSKGATTAITLGMAKAAGLMVIDEELARSSSPSAEMLVRDDLIETNKTFIDVQFIDPNVAAVANESPASITNGVTPLTPTGTNAAALRADVQTLFKSWIAANVDPSKGVWIMTGTQALAISMIQNALGQPEFPTISMTGGTWFGLPVIVSQSANIPGSPDSGNMIILLNAPEVMLADDGQMVISVSREASIQMLDNPTNQSTGATVATSMVSMFQTHSLAIKGVRFINWGKRRATAVAYIREAAYVA